MSKGKKVPLWRQLELSILSRLGIDPFRKVPVRSRREHPALILAPAGFVPVMAGCLARHVPASNTLCWQKLLEGLLAVHCKLVAFSVFERRFRCA
jgi:hypothetical protein